MYIVRDATNQSEVAHPSLQDARYAALNIKEGEIVRVKLNDNLSKAHLRCALFNRSDYASAFKVIATIENGIARRA